MAEHEDRQNTGEANTDDRNRMAAGASAGGTLSESQRTKAQTGGEQTDQLSGETPKGAHNQDKKNRNPSGGKQGRNRGAGHEGGF